MGPTDIGSGAMSVSSTLNKLERRKQCAFIETGR